jgi:hypothetical protein
VVRASESHAGNISPRNMIRGGRYKRLLNFVLEAREAANAAPGSSGDPENGCSSTPESSSEHSRFGEALPTLVVVALQALGLQRELSWA